MIKAGFIQFKPVFGDIQKNISIIDPFLKCTKEADLILLPELASTGYNFDNKESAFQCAETLEKSTFVNYLIEKSKEYNQYLLYNSEVYKA